MTLNQVKLRRYAIGAVALLGLVVVLLTVAVWLLAAHIRAEWLLRNPMSPPTELVSTVPSAGENINGFRQFNPGVCVEVVCSPTDDECPFESVQWQFNGKPPAKYQGMVSVSGSDWQTVYECIYVDLPVGLHVVDVSFRYTDTDTPINYSWAFRITEP